jgi:uroporphyrinogen III methyltransferase/synthase
VILVGAGPGPPDLLTLRALRALERADVVVHDALVSPEVLELAPGAEKIDVGRRAHETPTRSQEDINGLLVRLALEGRQVVRLKGGDPFVFGRGGEEASACRAAGVPFEVVPGVTSAIAAPAFAGIPLTDRRHAASFAVVTGHRDPTRAAQSTRWDLLAQAVDTLVILMGRANLGRITEAILAAGRDPETPAAAVVSGATTRQRVLVGTLATLAERVAQEEPGVPVTVVVGDVVRLRSELAWWDARPLFGRRVLVTRPRAQIQQLAEPLRAAGAEPVGLPLIELEEASDARPLEAALQRLADYDAVVFTSANAARFTAARAAALGLACSDPAWPRVVCVGPATAAEASQLGYRVDLVPDLRFDADGVFEAIERAIPPRGRRFLLPRAEEARERLPEALREAGAEVDAVVAYRTAPAELEPSGLRRDLVRGRLDVLTFTSPSAVRRFGELLDETSRRAALRCVIAAIGRTTAAALEERGMAPAVVAERAESGALVAALEAHFAGGTA